MSSLFSSYRIGPLTVKNRFMNSATHESMADPVGGITDPLLRRYRQLARGDIGLIVPGHMFVHPTGRAGGKQIGICSDELVDGLRSLVSVIHEGGAKVVFQLAHAGRQTTREITGLEPISPSNDGMDPRFGVEPREMTESEILELIDAFGSAARRAAEAGADGVQVHAAHGYLGSQFLSPFFNRREDQWGGSAENRFRFLKEVLAAVRQNVTADMPVMVKLNTADYTPQPGITPDLAATYAKWLAELGIDAIEISSGTISYSPLVMSRSKDEEGAFAFRDAYHLETAEMIKPEIGKVPLLLVGGMRKLAQMEQVIDEGKAEIISMCRPFIHQPNLVKRFAAGQTKAAGCISCNNCLLASRQGLPLRCYVRGVPES